MSSPVSWWSLLVLALTVLLAHCTLASYGDRHPYFGNCVRLCADCCEREAWGLRPGAVDDTNRVTWDCTDFATDERSVWERASGLWPCERECAYRCMWNMVDEMRRQGYGTVQFYGRWPFKRYFGLQEPASVIFSLLNLFTFAYLALQVYRLPFNAEMRNVWSLYAWLGIGTWFCSCIFHAYDTPWTERLDYFSAGASVLCSLYCCVCRVALAPRRGSGRWAKALLALPFVYLYAVHVDYLSTVKFDYGYNMKASVVVGAAASVLWLCWCARECAYGVSGVTWRRVAPCVAVVVLGNASLALELLDFAPLADTFDAHAVWHLVTVPLPVVWARFVVEDCRHLTESVREKQQGKMQ